MDLENKPLVSILIPTHERPHYFALALASAVNQTYDNIEIIISDNSSGDETQKLVEEFKKTYKNIKYFHTPDLPMWDNWQKCWDNMSDDAQYINFLMDDDLFAPNKIEYMAAQFLSNPDISLVTSYRKLIDKDGNFLEDKDFNASPFTDKLLHVKGYEAGLHFLLTGKNWIGEPTTVLFNREYTDGFFKGWVGDEKYLILDYPLWLRLLEKGDMIYINEPLSFFRLHDENDQKDFRTIVKGSVSMALTIKNAWNNKKYLDSPDKLHVSQFHWIREATLIIANCYEDHYKGEEFDDLLLAYKDMCERYIEKEPDKLSFHF
ncbi:Glycosyltransferase involved in cell wall bisynthesis [Butyrivibrio fibrisolvens DSM 3071]|uniref:Glycosyltransferase involved in cell wall bisynthesis n=1 Tax=Butyrivibrio fibrisolvens DSM 3071 TaxID=1121131 RepID=A0A1M5YYW9_BUTFI|nr:glycosyltransferase [Butyrivibrio fibrisolvens]SHI17165.1 Glycosyltransferase involved in cell wall bisynthesis [Butyrivibrio fibrisolvens DSM 3071]